MSRLTALITMLVIGSSSVAMAGSSYARHERSSWRERDHDLRGRELRYQDVYRRDFERDHRGSDDFGPRRYRPTWVALSHSLQLAYGRDAIEVDFAGTFTQLRLQTASGRSYIDRVIVRFMDGSRQVADVRRVLDASDRMFEIQLDGNNRRIDRIEVLGDSSRSGAIQVFAI
jgi:hypothetical protein